MAEVDADAVGASTETMWSSGSPRGAAHALAGPSSPNWRQLEVGRVAEAQRQRAELAWQVREFVQVAFRRFRKRAA
eukprot:10608737-Alexandrium_andersonii.AAC.1